MKIFIGHPARVDAGELRRFRVAADGEDIAAEARARGEEGHDDADAERDQHRDGEPVGDEQSAFRRTVMPFASAHSARAMPAGQG